MRDTSKQWSLKIKPSQLIYLKDDPDFLTMVKFGRGINALSFAVVASVGFDAFFDGGFKRSPLSFLSLPDLIR